MFPQQPRIQMIYQNCLLLNFKQPEIQQKMGIQNSLHLLLPFQTLRECSRNYSMSMSAIFPHIIMCRKLYEVPPILVPGGEEEWFEEIAKAIKEAIKNRSWKPGTGRAVLVLCEDIRTASLLKDVLSKVEEIRKITFYAHSGDSNELKSIKHDFDSGEVVIATNLAGRGTNIKVNHEIRKSGGLFCIVTFLPRNRRVELQAFGRTARKGQPGSVQCILDISTLPPHYRNLDLDSIRELRSKEEKIRLDNLMNSDVKEVKLKEKLFKIHCKYIADVHDSIMPRNDKRIVLNSLNENWGKWLQMNSQRIDQLVNDDTSLIEDLKDAHEKWRPEVPEKPTDAINLPSTNFYYLIKFGNQQLTTQDTESLQKACEYYSSCIGDEPVYSAFAYYNHAYCTICLKKDGYMDRAISHLKKAKDRIFAYSHEALSVMNCVNTVNQIQQRTQVESVDDKSPSDLQELKTQMDIRLQLLDLVEKKIVETIEKLESFKKQGDDALAEEVGVFSLIPDPDPSTEQQLYTLWNLGMEVTFSVKKKPKFRWDALAVFLLGAVELVGGALLTAFTAGAAAEFGMTLIGEGISDMFDGAAGMITGEFSLKQWAIYKAIGLAASLASGGISRLAGFGGKAARFATKIEELKEAKQIFKNATKYGEAARDSARTAMKYVGKQIVEEGTTRLVSYVGNIIFDHAIDEIANKCKKDLMEDSKKAFSEGKLGDFVNKHFICKLSEEHISDDEMSPVIEKDARAFFSHVGETVFQKLVETPEIRQYLTTASLSLLSSLSEQEKMGKSAVGGELIIGAAQLAEARKNVKKLTDEFIPQTEKTSAEFIHHNETSTPPPENRKANQLKCTETLKDELAGLVGENYGEAVKASMHNDLDNTLNHGLNRTVGHLARKLVSDHVLHTGKSYEHLLAGQHANYIRYARLSKPEGSEESHSKQSGESHSEHSDQKPAKDSPSSAEYKAAKDFAEKVRDPDTPGSVLELRILAEQYHKRVTVYQQKNGKLKYDYTINMKLPDTIELVHIPPCERHPNGHYILKDDPSETTSPKSKDSNCLYRAFTKGMNPDLSPDEVNKKSLEERRKVADYVSRNPLLADHIIRRRKMEQLDKGDYYARLGAGYNARTKVLNDCFKENKRGKKLSVTYLQKNNIICQAERVYNKNITVDEGRVIDNGERLESLHVYMSGLNFPKNIGRCWTTKKLTGMVKITLNGEDISELFPLISYHVNPSEAGANASNETANALISSERLNNIERYIWKTKVASKTMRKWIGRMNFESLADIKAGPLLPQDFDDWFKDMNKAREAQGREPISDGKKKDLCAFLEHLQSLEPRLHRMEGYTYTLKNFRGEVRSVTMPRDYDLFVPEDANDIPKRSELDRLQIESIVEGHKFDTPPYYQDTSDLDPYDAQKKKFRDALETAMIKELKGKRDGPDVDVEKAYNEAKRMARPFLLFT